MAGIHLSWAKKPVEPRKVKSLAEIQAEEQEMLAKVIFMNFYLAVLLFNYIQNVQKYF